MWCTYCGSEHGPAEPHASPASGPWRVRPTRPARQPTRRQARQKKKAKAKAARREAAKPAGSYAERDALLRQLGFRSYREYLDSPLWTGIRERHLRIYQHCHCGRWARQVHHQKYSLANLSGKSPAGLRSVCAGCHVQAEFEGDRKLDLNSATAKFTEIKKSHALTEGERERLKPGMRLLGDMNREFRAIVRGSSILLT